MVVLEVADIVLQRSKDPVLVDTWLEGESQEESRGAWKGARESSER